MSEEIVLQSKKVFVAHSFNPDDVELVNKVKDFLSYFGIRIDSGERPDARSISDKIKARIVDCDILLGLFTKRHKIEGTAEFTTSQWVVEEKSYAVSLNKKILLYVEEGVQFSPGLQSDFEFVKFSREALSDSLIKSIPYIFSVISHERTNPHKSSENTLMDRFEALRIMKELEADGLNKGDNEDEQNLLLRIHLSRGMAVFQFDGDYESCEYFVNFLNSKGYKISPISRQLFLRYTVISKEAINNERLKLAQLRTGV